ncbi:hypothetical protein [Trichodesmium erythraeum]|uniref:hypothetical protein n=1 Tax=Trichodesmium erythraeum TaxID=1206 RepID=UPI00003C9C1D|nr:hypothetical protein [Trichodesmium erythraeum GBRTRLIN201]MDE5094276.1 hypothetical protein [Trichodesmium sp. St11_bin5]
MQQWVRLSRQEDKVDKEVEIWRIKTHNIEDKFITQTINAAMIIFDHRTHSFPWNRVPLFLSFV